VTRNAAHDAVRLLVVHRSPVARERLRNLFDSASGIEVVGEAGSGEKALHVLEETSPSAVLIDCNLSGMDSFAVVQEMMSLYRVPIVMMTEEEKIAGSPLEARALTTGAVALVHWQHQNSGDSRDSTDRLIRVVRAMSEVKVVRRRDSGRRQDTGVPGANAAPMRISTSGGIEVVAIGASTGGPPVIQTILRRFSRSVPVPILLVQHISRGFQDSFLRWLADSTGMPVVLGQHGMPPAPGVVHLGPDDRHMTVDRSGRLVLNDDPPENGSRPSVSVLFRSVAQCYGAAAIGVLLTGMGRDGALELRLMRDKGAITIAQDEGTSVVHGMPGEAIKLKGARYVLAPDRIASVIEHHLGGPARTPHEAGAVPTGTR
jgi:two-component system chemotaxis response regulator CheB